METAPTILEIGAVLLVAAAAGLVARHFHLPAVLGYLAVGLLVSPFTPGYVAERHQLQILADVGVVLLLFEVGIEVDLGRLHREHAGLIWAAPLQAALTTLITAVVLWLLGLSWFAAGVLGIAIAMSSSVVIVNITRSRMRTTDRETEVALLGWSVLQDVTGVAMAGVLLAVGSPQQRSAGDALLALAAFVALVILAARLLPVVLRRLRAEHDLFLIVSVATGLALAGAGAVGFGVPTALAAFVAGLAIAESPESAEARRRVLPFRDLFAVLFFVAVGSLIDPGALGAGLGWLAVFAALLLGAKTAMAYVLARIARLRARPQQLAIGLSQVGEFSFVLGSILLAQEAIPAAVNAALLALVAGSTAFSTVLVRRFGEAHVAAVAV
jgi:CPA2 family monovalent cation:H+ antiporter-2